MVYCYTSVVVRCYIHNKKVDTNIKECTSKTIIDRLDFYAKYLYFN